MHRIWIISKREINAFFDTLMAYILLVVFLGVSGIFTWLLGGSDIFFVGQASLQGFFGVAFWTLFFFIPAVTMRMVAEEESSGTLELLATKPVKHYQIIAGKWLASWLLIVISLALTLPYYITVASLGPLDHGAAISGYLALLFVSGVYTSIGIFASSLTSNQIVAFILSLFIAFFFHFLFGQITTLLPQSLANLLEFLSMDQHYQTMSRGVIGIENIIYMISIILLGFVFATTALKRRLW
ncbi:MAG: ABC transporter permease subunit [Balneolaceae bacterium]|nr:ABC transporter permease subunit [Balneolaceae bacterium]